MTRETLLDFFEDFASHAADTFVVHDDGYRVTRATYRQVIDASRAWAAELARRGLARGDNVLIWSENSIEWIVALWGALLAGVVVVPIDFRVSPDFVQRIAHIVSAKAILVGEEVPALGDAGAEVWRLREAIPVGPGPWALGPGHGPTEGQGPRAEGRTREASGLTSATLAEILFTSGATAEPKGVTITHRNILANIVPIEREVKKYLRYERPFHPIRFLNLLPLSHMFGQSMATFVPPMLGGTVVFTHGYTPGEILRQIKTRRVSVLVAVPKVLDVLADHVRRLVPATAGPAMPAGTRWWRRWWRHRRVHRLFGWKFWCLIVGAAPLDPALEAFWRELGFLVVQGYGLTETAPIVTLNHPFHASSGTVGTPLGGVDVKIAPDGEILVRGDNVTSGYYNAAADTREAFENGWFHTGDVGEVDANGRLVIKGRKKEMIVTPQGLNVFPEDVERAVNAQPGVKESAVVGVRTGGEERIHAVLLVDPGADVDAIVRGANAQLEDHQRVWSASVWPGAELPRTEGTRKLKRREIQQWAAGGRAAAPAGGGAKATAADVVRRFAAARDIGPGTTLDELGLSSLDRVELQMALEDAFHVSIDEASFADAKTVGELQQIVDQASGLGPQAPDEHTLPAARGPGPGAPHQGTPGAGGLGPGAFPSWNRSAFAHFIRRISLPTWILPLGLIFMKLRVEGLEQLRDLEGPVIFAANHQSHLDTPAILLALPARWRYRVAPAMAKEFFTAHFHPRGHRLGERFTNGLNYYLAAEFFNAFPLPQREAGTRQTLRYIGEVIASGNSILIFPEGRRAEHEEIGEFRPGVGMMAAKLDVPVVPVRLQGLDGVLGPGMRVPRRGPVRVAFGAPLALTGEEYPALAKRVEEAVRAL